MEPKLTDDNRRVAEVRYRFRCRGVLFAVRCFGNFSGITTFGEAGTTVEVAMRDLRAAA